MLVDSQSTLQLASNGEMSISTFDKMSLKPVKDLEIDAGTSATIKSKTTMDVEATAKLAIKGQIVTIN